MNYQELKDKIEKIGLGQIAEEDFNVKDINENFSAEDFNLVYAEGGGEGDGDYAERVFQHENVFVKITGYYSSYEGTDWDEISEVQPKQKTVTVYE